MLLQVIKIFITSYQKISSVIFPGKCRFYPTCSRYALEAIQKYGIFLGGIKAFIRILRCTPLSKGGYDPVR